MTPTSTQTYIELLEKTNEQLSFWYLPYELAIGFLTVAIAVLTVGFSFMLWRQSIDYKKKIDELIKEQEKYLKTEIASSSLAVLKEHIKKLEESAGKATGDVRQEKERALEVLRSSVISSKQAIPSLADPQIQAIESLLVSFGADRKVLNSTGDILRGRDTYLPESAAIQRTLTDAQINALISLLQSFGADSVTIGHIYSVLQMAQV